MRIFRAIGNAAALVAVASLALAPAAHGDDIRTDPEGLAGYRINATTAPVSIRIFEPTIPIPADPGVPNFELTIAHTSTTLRAGPVSRAVASLVWPGPGVGDGFGTFAEEFGMDPESEYPLRAAAQYPGDRLEHDQQLPTGAGMRAVARGLDVAARADFSGELIPGVARAGVLRSTSVSTIEDGVARAVADSVVSDLSLLEGLIVVDEMRTRLVATSDGEQTEARGATDFVGLTVAGTRFGVNREGVTIEDEAEDSPFDVVPGLPLRLRGVVDLQDLIGVSVELAPLDEGDDDREVAAGERLAGGVLVTIDADLLFRLARELPLDVLIENLPDELQGQIITLLSLSPTVEVWLGRGSVISTATLPLQFDPPDVDPGDFSQDVGGFDFDAGMDMDFGVPLDSPPPSFDTPATAPAPDVGEAPVALPATPALSAPDWYEGIPPALVVVTALLVAAAAFGLDRLTGMALPAAAAVDCAHPGGNVPDLRDFAAR